MAVGAYATLVVVVASVLSSVVVAEPEPITNIIRTCASGGAVKAALEWPLSKLPLQEIEIAFDGFEQTFTTESGPRRFKNFLRYGHAVHCQTRDHNHCHETCPENMKIAFGFKIAFNGHNHNRQCRWDKTTACPFNGQNCNIDGCGHSNGHDLLYMLCQHDNARWITRGEQIVHEKGDGSKTVTATCRAGEQIAFGFSVHNSDHRVSSEHQKCLEANNKACPIGATSCTAQA